jgi:hypothetical protein
LGVANRKNCIIEKKIEKKKKRTLLDLTSRNIDVCQVAQEKLVRGEGAIHPPLYQFFCFSLTHVNITKSQAQQCFFFFFFYLSSTLWDTPTAKVHNPVPWERHI